jgi:hypothetical protein
MPYEKGGAAEHAGAGIGGGNDGVVYLSPLQHMAAAECYGPSGLKWRAGYDENAVMTAGLAYVINHVFGSLAQSTVGAHLFLHYATVGSGNAWSNISNSQVSGYGNNVPNVTFASNGANMSQSASASYTFSHAGTQTVSGCGLHMYTTNTLSTNAATGNILMYAYGTFSNGSRAVQSNDTLNVTLTLTYITA